MKKFSVTIKSKTEEFEPYVYEFEAESYDNAVTTVHGLCEAQKARYENLQQIYYRWVNDGDLTSVYATGDLRVRYRVGEFVSAPVGKLFLFGDLESANRWYYGEWIRDVSLYECEAIGVEGTETGGRLCTWVLCMESAKLYWSGKFNGNLVSFQYGVVLADQVKLIREVK